MTARELLNAGRIDESLSALQSEIRAQPGDPHLRLFLFQLDCLLGHWDRALHQLQTASSLDPEIEMLARIFQPVIACEVLRREVFAGVRSPLLFGEPEPWLGWLVQAVTFAARGEWAAAGELRARAFEAAEATPGRVDRQDFAWIADADSRLGPVLEVILDGKYYWLPFCRLARVRLEKPTDLRDLVWTPAHFTLINGGAVSGHIPVRYPGTEGAADGLLRLARRTEWSEPVAGTFVGLGHRVLATDAGEYPLLECREIEFDAPASAGVGAGSPGAGGPAGGGG